MSMMIPKPGPEELLPYFQRYIDKATGTVLFEAFDLAHTDVLTTLSKVPNDREEYRYAPGKWSIREVLRHVIDTERILAFRALCFARGEQAALPGFDENAYVTEATAYDKDLSLLLEEYKAVRTSTLFLFRSFPADTTTKSGVANGARMSVRAAGWAIAGHAVHHMAIIRERYL